MRHPRKFLPVACLLALLWLWLAAAPTYADGPIFRDNGQQFPDSSSSYDVALGDLDGDDDLDAFVSNEGANRAVFTLSCGPLRNEN